MRVIAVRNVNKALQEGLQLLEREGRRIPSRNGDMTECRHPVSTVYRNPRERVLFSTVRDCNPFFHMYESMWMLAGANSVAPLAQMVSRMKNFSDDGEILSGAYGYRWRNHFGRDNLERVVDELKARPESRRAYLPMWDGEEDAWELSPGIYSADVPCNVGVNFRLREECLHMTVFNRSNDIIWGAYGANVVHMSFLQEYVACRIGAIMGNYTQVSDSFHIYPDLPVTKRVLSIRPDMLGEDYYTTGKVNQGIQLFLSYESKEFHRDLLSLREPREYSSSGPHPESQYFRSVFNPMMMAWAFYKDRMYSDARDATSLIVDSDWRVACQEWLERRTKDESNG